MAWAEAWVSSSFMTFFIMLPTAEQSDHHKHTPSEKMTKRRSV